MKTAHSIKIEFRQISSQAETLENCAEDLQKVAKQLQEMTDHLYAGWRGDSASLYGEKCEQLQQKIQHTGKNLAQISSVVKHSARRYYDAEIKALDTAKDRGRS